MKHLTLIFCLLLTACGSSKIIHTDGGANLEFFNPLPDNLSHEAFFTHPNIVFDFEYSATKACPTGYSVSRKYYNKETRLMTWEIECYEPK